MALGAAYIASHNVGSVVSWFRDAHRVTALGTLVLASGTIALALVSRQQIQVMKDDQRPWVDIINIKIVNDITFSPNGAAITVQFNLNNTGHTPGMKVSTWFVPFAKRDGWLDRIKKFENPVRGDQGFFGETIFPGNSSILRLATGNVPREDVDAAEKRVGRTFDVMAQLCAEYSLPSDESDQERRKTCYTFQLTQTNGYLFSIPNPEAAIPQSNISGKFFPGGSFAN